MKAATFLESIGDHLRRRIGLYFEIITAAAGIAAFVAHFFVEISETTLIELTIVLLALLAVTGLIERITKLEDVEKKVEAIHSEIVTDRLADKLYASTTRGDLLLPRLAAAKIIGIHSNLADTSWSEKVRTAKSIRVLTTWTGISGDLDEALKVAIQSGARARVLYLDPDSVHARQRSYELGEVESFAQSQIKNELQYWDFYSSVSPEFDKADLRLYDANPVVYLICCDETILMGLFWRRQMAAHAPFLELELGAGAGQSGCTLAQLADRHFEDLWSKSRPRLGPGTALGDDAPVPPPEQGSGDKSRA